MSTQQEKRQFTRTDVNWPVVLLTPQRILTGEAKNISPGGAFLYSLTDPLEDESFRIVIKPPTSRRFLMVTAEVAWTSHRRRSDDFSSPGVGVQFTKIAAGDLQLLSSLT